MWTVKRMDFTEWLGAEVTVGQKAKTLPDRVVNALQKVWDEDILEEDDIPEDGTSLDDVQLEHDLKIVQRAFSDGVKLLHAEKFQTDEEKLSAWFRARFSNSSTDSPVLLAGTASKVIMTKEFEDDLDDGDRVEHQQEHHHAHRGVEQSHPADRLQFGRGRALREALGARRRPVEEVDREEAGGGLHGRGPMEAEQANDGDGLEVVDHD